MQITQLSLSNSSIKSSWTVLITRFYTPNWEMQIEQDSVSLPEDREQKLFYFSQANLMSEQVFAEKSVHRLTKPNLSNSDLFFTRFSYFSYMQARRVVPLCLHFEASFRLIQPANCSCTSSYTALRPRLIINLRLSWCSRGEEVTYGGDELTSYVGFRGSHQSFVDFDGNEVQCHESLDFTNFNVKIHHNQRQR